MPLNNNKITNWAGTSYKKMGLMLLGMLPKRVYSLGDDGDEDIYVPHIRFSPVSQYLHQRNPVNQSPC